MFNLVAVNLRDKNKDHVHNCHLKKCPNPGRYQLYGAIEDGGLPDWEGQPICSKHLVEEIRHRPEIVMSLLDMLFDALEDQNLLTTHAVPQGAGSPIIPFRKA
jgi:hypothetical protein